MLPLRYAFVNGEWVEDCGLSIPVSDLGFLQGVTITERLRTFGGRVWRQADHLKRLHRSAEIVGIDTSAIDEIAEAIDEFAKRHEPARLAASSDNVASDWTIVAFATPGSGDEPTRVVHGMPLPFARWAHQYRQGVKLWISDHREVPADCWPPELKHRSRMHYYLADRQAASQEPGAAALLLDDRGFICQTAIANVVIYTAEEGIVSPRLDRALPGISVGVLRELAAKAGLSFTERDLTPDEFLAADEAWLTNTSSCLLPVASCNGEPIGSGTPGEVYRRMLAAWSNAVGLDIAEQAEHFAERR